MSDLLIGRFAPSPSGRMHAGNLFSSLISWLLLKLQGGLIVLRIEDLDQQRSKQEWINYLLKDYELFGLEWDRGPFYQSTQGKLYEEYLDELTKHDLIYPCFCTRADYRRIAQAPHGNTGFVYPGTCRKLDEAICHYKMNNQPYSLRLKTPDALFEGQDLIAGHIEQNLKYECGDFILKRADGAYSYHLASVIDDHCQGINYIVRGSDLIESCSRQWYLQDLLHFRRPTYAHIPLYVNAQGLKLSKRDQATHIQELLDLYKTPERIIGHIAYVSGLIEEDTSISPEQLLHYISVDDVIDAMKKKRSIPFL